MYVQRLISQKVLDALEYGRKRSPNPLGYSGRAASKYSYLRAIPPAPLSLLFLLLILLGFFLFVCLFLLFSCYFEARSQAVSLTSLELTV